MPPPLENQTVNDAFFQPLHGLAARSLHARACPEVSDPQSVILGVQRVLEASPSGRAFLHEHGPRHAQPPNLANYFASLHSRRRGAVLQEVNQAVLAAANTKLPDRLAELPELARCEVFAAAGHWHKAAAHDPRQDGVKMAVGHCYRLHLRTHTRRPLATGQGWHEHDLSALKRLKPRGLRQGVPTGRRILIVYDKAAIDFTCWKRCRQEGAVYFLSRAKENQVLAGEESLPGDRKVPPGVLAELYRRRWAVEKVFDELKNKLGQKKAWGSGVVAKETPAQFAVLTHNLMRRYEATLATRPGVGNRAEDQRRARRTSELVERSARQQIRLPSLLWPARRATQRSVKYIRWRRPSLREQLPEAPAVLRRPLLDATL